VLRFSVLRRRCVVSPPLIYVKWALIIVKEVGESGDVEKTEKATAVEEENDSDSGSSDGEDLLTAMAAVKIEESPWQNAPTYPSLYLSTVAEYLSPQSKPRLPKDVIVDDLGDEDKKDKDVSWAKETYEDSLEVDQVFERFMKRVGYEGEQCVRLVF
jgi:pre-rRNA-processing protein TSR4